jgi:triosephosphate isomerase
MKAKKLIVGNWKANPESLREAKEIFNPIKKAAGKFKNVETVICPPAVWIGGLASGKGLALGGQDAFWELSGAYTGQLGPTMIRNAGATYVIIAHSEARTLGDTDNIVNAKVRLALKHDLKVILCVGEKERDSKGKYLEVLRGQIESALAGIPKVVAKRIILAYEPIWAIGAAAKGVDTPAGFLEQAIFIRKVLAGIIGKASALETQILYGGSANADNAGGFLGEGGASGLLVGRASLSPESFIKILKVANSVAF